MRPRKKSISVSLDKPLVERLRVEATRDERSLSSYINIILRKHLSDEKSEK